MAKPRVLVGGYVHEGHSFVDGNVTLRDFREDGYLVEGPRMLILDYVQDAEINGLLSVLGDTCEVVPSILGWANSGAALTRDAYEHVVGAILAAIDRAAPLDGVALILHGASLADGQDDPEGDLLSRVRARVGAAVPIVATLDLHANVTSAMVRSSSALVGYQTCPHTDLYNTGRRAGLLLAQGLSGSTTLTMAASKVPMIVPAPSQDTDSGPAVPIFKLARDLEGLPSVRDVSIFMSQPHIDVAELGWTVVVVTDGAHDLAWDHRHDFSWRGIPPDEAVRQALLHEQGPIALADGADSPTAGANGDGNVLLRELLGAGIEERCLLTVVDAPAARAAFDAGPGAEVEVSLGGRLSPAYYEPVGVRAVVVSVHDGPYWLDLHPKKANVGLTALLRIGAIDVVVTERRPYMLDASIFRHAGVDPRDYRIVQVKSGGGYKAAYRDIVRAMIDMATPGPATSDFATLPFGRLDGPIWPIAQESAVSFRRPRRLDGGEAPI
jgi:microcystin degradation protein MlrC